MRAAAECLPISIHFGYMIKSILIDLNLIDLQFFRGGAEILFENVKKQDLSLPIDGQKCKQSAEFYILRLILTVFTCRGPEETYFVDQGQ